MSKPVALMSLASVAVLCVVGVVFLADGRGEGAASSRAAVVERAPARGGQIVLSMQGQPSTLLLPFCTSEDETNIAGLLFPTLFDITFRGELRHAPYLAKSWEAAPDGLSITVTLKDAKWDDGRPIVAEDVIATYAMVANPDFPSPKREYTERIAGVDRLDERRVRFRYKTKYYLENQLSDANVGILPAHVYGAMVPRDVSGTDKALAPVGHGPFRVVSRDGTRMFVLERNESSVTQTPPLLHRVTFTYSGDYAARKNALVAGDVDAIDGVRPDDVDPILKRGGYVAKSRGLRSVDFVAWNTKKTPFESADLRRALTMAIDRDGMNKAVFRVSEAGAYAVSVGTVPPVLEIACATDIAPIPYDPVGAEKELDRLGWKRSAAGTRAKDGIPLAFTLLVNSDTPRRVESATMIQQDLAKVGIDAQIEKLPFDALKGRVMDRKYEAAIYGFQSSLELKQGDVWGAGAMFNVSDYSNHELQTVLDRIRDETDREKIVELLKEMQRIVYRDQPFTFLCWFSRFAMARDRIHDFAPNVLAFTNDLNLWFVPLPLQTSFRGK